MAPKSRSSAQLPENEKVKRRREQKQNSIRRARAKMTEADLEDKIEEKKDIKRERNKDSLKR